MLKLSDVKNVLILGDSFTDINYWNGENEQHWINFLRLYYGWKIINLSKSGSGINRIVHELLNLTYDFDLCIMAHSQPSRIYHPEIWDINVGTAVYHKELRRSETANENVWDAALGYYTHFHHNIFTNIKGIGLHQWIDEYIRKKYPDKYFIHFNCFSMLHSTEHNHKDKEVQRIYHEFSHGITMYPPLMYLSAKDPKMPNPSTDYRPGHLSFDGHLTVFNGIKTVIEENLYNNIVYIYDNDFTENDIKVGSNKFE